MALASYSELLSSVASWLNRTDIDDRIPEFIALFEARANRLLRVPQMEATATNEATSETLALPDDYLSLRTVRVDEFPLAAYSPQLLRERFYEVTGEPQGYAVVGSNLLIAPAPTSADVEIGYYQKIPALTSEAPTNWLLEDYPDAYLYGTLTMAGAYLRDETMTAQFKGAWDEVLAEIEADAVKRRLPAGPLVAQSRVLNG